LCSVIKRAKDDAFEPYDFFEIHASSQGSEGRFAAPESGKPEALNHDAHAENSPLKDVETKVRQKLQEADRKAQEIEKTAYEKGYAQGQKDGFEYGLKSASIVKEQLENLLRGLSALPHEIHRDHRDWFVSASLAVARKIIAREISMDTEILMGMMDSLLQEAQADQNMVIRVNPKDLELLKNHLEFEKWLANNGESFSVKTDPSLRAGSCLLESDIQLIDGSVETQLEMIQDHWNTSMHGSEAQSP